MYNISPEIVKLVKYHMARIARTHEDEYSDINQVLSMLKQPKKSWELIPATSLFALNLFQKGKSHSEKLALLELLNSSIDPLEQEYQFLMIPSQSTPPNREYILFHTELALGILLFTKSAMALETSNHNPYQYGEHILCKQRATSLIHRTASVTSLISDENYPYVQKGRTTLYGDVADLKMAANPFIYSHLMTNDTPDPGPYLFYAAGIWKERLGPSNPNTWGGDLLSCFPFDQAAFNELKNNIYSAMDIWTMQCLEMDAKEKTFPTLKWLDLITAILSFLPRSAYDSNRFESPANCAIASSQHLSWKFGYCIGACVNSAIKSGISISDIQNYLTQRLIQRDIEYSIESINDSKDIYEVLPIIIDYVNNCHADINWNSKRQTAISLWKCSKRSDKISINSITPASDIYWAIYSGLSDSMSNIPNESFTATGELHITPITDTVESQCLINPGELVINDTYFRNRIGDLYDRLPGKVTELLQSCKEEPFNEIGIRHAIFDYDIAINYWLQILITFHLDKDIKLINDYNPIIKGQNPALPSHLSNNLWGKIIKESCTLPQIDKTKDYWPYRLAFENYVKAKRPNINKDLLKKSAKQLMAIGELRNSVVHEGGRHISEKELQRKLETTEQLVFGNDGKPGLIVNLYQLFQEDRFTVQGWDFTK